MTFIIPIAILGCYYKWHTHNILRNSGQLIYMKGVKQIRISRTNYGTRNSYIYLLWLLLISSTLYFKCGFSFIYLFIPEFHTEVSELFANKTACSICVQNQSHHISGLDPVGNKYHGFFDFSFQSQSCMVPFCTYVRYGTTTTFHISLRTTIDASTQPIDNNNHETIINTSLFLFFL